MLFSPCESYRRMSDPKSLLARSLGERSDTSVVEPPAAVEHDRLDAGGLRAFGDQLPDGLRRTGLPVVPADLAVGGGNERPSGCVVDELRVDMPVGPEHGEAGPP